MSVSRLCQTQTEMENLRPKTANIKRISSDFILCRIVICTCTFGIRKHGDMPRIFDSDTGSGKATLTSLRYSSSALRPFPEVEVADVHKNHSAFFECLSRQKKKRRRLWLPRSEEKKHFTHEVAFREFSCWDTRWDGVDLVAVRMMSQCHHQLLLLVEIETLRAAR